MNNLFLRDPLVQMYARQVLRGEYGRFSRWPSILRAIGFIDFSGTTIFVRTRCGRELELERIAKHPDDMNCGRCHYLGLSEWESLGNRWRWRESGWTFDHGNLSEIWPDYRPEDERPDGENH